MTVVRRLFQHPVLRRRCRPVKVLFHFGRQSSLNPSKPCFRVSVLKFPSLTLPLLKLFKKNRENRRSPVVRLNLHMKSPMLFIRFALLLLKLIPVILIISVRFTDSVNLLILFILIVLTVVHPRLKKASLMTLLQKAHPLMTQSSFIRLSQMKSQPFLRMISLKSCPHSVLKFPLKSERGVPRALRLSY